ncbi:MULTISPECIES: formate/nitrite transporter family protein [unclassified Adlercreutzia]|uniref:formate/nitrite transporter family protein n=1 Tax=unclassified Adlercreutzia TaxID=2636013 RepID=UPI0013ED4B14|nr:MULTISPECIES: formate/nitrite transporter family protein [unclassified Adlercreutzia]
MPLFTPTEITDNYMSASVGKAASLAWRLFVLGVAAGLLIGLGAVTSSTAAHALDNAGLVRLVSGLVFPMGLIMVVLLGTELFTGNALMVTAALDGRISWGRLARNWAIVYVGNLAGAVALAALMAFFGQLNIGGGDLAVYTAKVAASKDALPWGNAFVLGIFCNLMVCIAVYLGNVAQDAAGRILGLYVPIMGFVLAGFEHCVANMYYIPAGIFAYLNPAYTQMIVDAGINTAVLDFGTFVTANLIPVTLGNIVGGVLVGVVMYACHGTKKAKAAKGKAAKA